MKKLIPLLLALAMLLCLCACGGGNETAAGDRSTPAETESETDDNTPEAPAENPAEEAQPAEELPEPEPAREMTSVSIGETIALDFVEMTIEESGFTDEVSLSVGGSTYRSSTGAAQDGMQYAYIGGTIKNLYTAELSVYNIIGEVVIDGYTYELEPGNILLAGDFAPLATCQYRMYAAVPDELVENHQSITFGFGFNELYDVDDYDKWAFETRDYQYLIESFEAAPGEAAAVSESGRAGSLWQKAYYVDEFNQPTEDAFIVNTTELVGTFSNSATTDSALLGNLLVDEENIAIMLYEYGRTQVKNIYSRDEAYTIKMKTADGTIVEMTGAIWSGGDRLVIDAAYRDQVIEALSALPVGDVAFVAFSIVCTDTPTTQYLLMAPMSNFGDVIGTLAE